MKTLDLAVATNDGAVRNLSGKERGEAVRSHFHLDRLDSEAESVRILVPKSVDVITPSFFQGMFSLSLDHLGSRDQFQEHYLFEASPHVMKWVNRGLDRCVMRRSALISDAA